MGSLIVGEKITHAVPLFSVLIFCFIYAARLRASFRNVLCNLSGKQWTWQYREREHSVSPKVVALWLWWYLGPLLLLLIYAMTHDAWEVDRSKLSTAESIVVPALTIGVFQTLLIWALYLQHRDEAECV